MLTIEPRRVSIFWSHSPISFKDIAFLVSVLRSTPNHMFFKYRCPDYCSVGFRHVHLRYKAKIPFIFVSHVEFKQSLVQI